MRRLTPEDVAAARRLDTFTGLDFMTELGVGKNTAGGIIALLCERGVIAPTGEKRKHGPHGPGTGPGRPASLFAYVPPPKSRLPEKKTPPEVEVRRQADKIPTRVSTGRKRRVRNSRLRALITAALDNGWTVDRTRNGHFQFRLPDGTVVGVSGSTPSDTRSLDNLRADLRRAGLDV